MALPASVNKADPADSDSPGQAGLQFRTLKTNLEDLFGLPDNTNITGAVFSLGANTDGSIATAPIYRSEERRVGKECRL